MTSTRPTTDMPSTAASAAVDLPPLAPAPNLSIGRSDRVPLDQMVKQLNLRSFAKKAAAETVPAVGAQPPAGTVPASAVFVADKGDLSLNDIASGAFAAKSSATEAVAPVQAKTDTIAQIERTLQVLEAKLATSRESEQQLRDTIKTEQGIIHRTEDELGDIDHDSVQLSGQARNLQGRLESATSRRSGATPGTPEAASATTELRALEQERVNIIDLARKLGSGRAQKQGLIDQAKLRVAKADALVSGIQPLLMSVEAQIVDARAMLETQRAQTAVTDSAAVMNGVREKLQDMLHTLGGEDLKEFEEVMATQAERDVRARMRDQQHIQDASRTIQAVTDVVNTQKDDAFMALCATPLDESAKVTGQLRSNIAKDSLARYGMSPPQQTQPAPQSKP